MDDHFFQNQLLDLEHQLASLTSRLYAGGEMRTEAMEAAATDAQCALDLCSHLVGASALLRSAKSVPEADYLVARLGGVDRIGFPPNADELSTNLPWLLRVTLELLLDADVVDNDPDGPAAIAARLLGAIVETTASPASRQPSAPHESSKPPGSGPGSAARQHH